MPSGVPDVVSKSFSALLPGFTTFVLWALVLKGLEAAGVAGGLNGLLGAIVGTPLKLIAGTLPGMILCVIVNSFFGSVELMGTSFKCFCRPSLVTIYYRKPRSCGCRTNTPTHYYITV